MKNTVRSLTFVIVSLIAAALCAPAISAAPAIAVTPTGLRATGITAGGDAVWFGFTVEALAQTPYLKRHVKMAQDQDRDGVVVFDTPSLTRFSLFFVADVATGEHAVHRGDGVDAIEHNLRGNAWRSALEHFDIPADFLSILLVRPAEGAWSSAVEEGDRKDGDGARNGRFRLKLKDLDPVAPVTAKANGNVRRGDLLVIVDPLTFAYAIRTARD